MIVCLSLAIKGYKMPLEAKDLWSLNPRDSSNVMVPTLLREWEKEQAQARRYSAIFLACGSLEGGCLFYCLSLRSDLLL